MYGSISEATTYFESRFHNSVWYSTLDSKKTRALESASRIVDNFNYFGEKEDPDQEHQFPRTGFGTPTKILEAVYEIAYALLDGRDPEKDALNLNVTGARAGLRYDSFDPKYTPLNILHGVPSLAAWNNLLPYFRDPNKVQLIRRS